MMELVCIVSYKIQKYLWRFLYIYITWTIWFENVQFGFENIQFELNYQYMHNPLRVLCVKVSGLSADHNTEIHCI